MTDAGKEAEALKPCPFCGGPAQLEPKNWAGRDWIGVFCVECGLFHDSRNPNDAEAIAAWNQRAACSNACQGGVLSVLERICDMQSRLYGLGTETHTELAGLCDEARDIIGQLESASGHDKLAGYAGVKDAEVNNSLPTQGGGAGDRETVARIVRDAVISASVEDPEDFAERVKMRETIAKNTTDAILSALQAAPSEGKITRQQVAKTLDLWVEWCEENETKWDGHGDGHVPEGATTWTINAKAARALIANDAPRFAAPSEGGEPVAWREALEPFDVVGIPAWGDDEKVHLTCDGQSLGSIRLGAFRRLAAARPPAPSEEPLVGCVVVPREPTLRMVEAGFETGRVLARDDVKVVWHAMRAAAPAPDAIRGGE